MRSAKDPPSESLGPPGFVGCPAPSSGRCRGASGEIYERIERFSGTDERCCPSMRSVVCSEDAAQERRGGLNTDHKCGFYALEIDRRTSLLPRPNRKQLLPVPARQPYGQDQDPVAGTGPVQQAEQDVDPTTETAGLRYKSIDIWNEISRPMPSTNFYTQAWSNLGAHQQVR